MLRSLFKFFFLIVPFFILGGLELIFLHKKEVVLYSYEVKNQKRQSKKELDRKIINDYLKRCHKQGE